MRHHTILLLVALFALASPALIRAQNVLVVDDDGGPGVAFRDIDAALAAASSGDTILVKPGRYGLAGTIQFPDKSVRVVADGGGVSTDSILVQGLSQGNSVVIRGLRIVGAHALVVDNCQGTVWVEDCELVGVASPGIAGSGAFVRNSASVTMVGCTAYGSALSIAGLDQASAGLYVLNSTVHLFETRATGATPFASLGSVVIAGGPGMWVDSSDVYVQRCAFEGGQGGSARTSPCIPGGSGGAGIMLLGGTSILRHLATQFTGGAGGPATGGCPAGSPGPGLAQLGGTVTGFPGGGHTLRSNSPVREAQSVQLTVEGAAGDSLVLVFSLGSGRVMLDALRAPLLIDLGGFFVVPIGAIPAGGSVTRTLNIPELGGSTQAVDTWVQVLAANSFLGLSAGSARAVTLLDRRF